MKTRPITDAQEAPCEYVIKCVNKVCERNCPLAINSMQFAEFIFHILIPFHILTQHVNYQNPQQ